MVKSESPSTSLGRLTESGGRGRGAKRARVSRCAARRWRGAASCRPTHCFLLADPAKPSAAGRAPPAHTRAIASASHSRKRENAANCAPPRGAHSRRRLLARVGRREKGGVSVKVAAFWSRRGRRRRHEGRRRRCRPMRPRVRASVRAASLRAIGRVCRHGAERLDRARFESSSAAHARTRLRTHAPRAHTAAARRPAPAAAATEGLRQG